ncbi:hypothetical protein GCM10009740_32950 [Terrabacter terrae]|uniref:Phage holin family protein n=1 Tax=Terrabacter terrae TaxID=318434 RepID=A0ABP5G5D9_9MICO
MGNPATSGVAPATDPYADAYAAGDPSVSSQQAGFPQAGYAQADGGAHVVGDTAYGASTTGATTGYESSHEKAQHASLGDLVGDISRDFSTLIRQEVELAKAEAKQSATRASKAGGMFGGAALAGWMTLLFLSIAVWEFLSSALDSRGWAAVIVMVVWAIVAAVLAARGRRLTKEIQGLPRTTETVKKVPDALKGNEEIR